MESAPFCRVPAEARGDGVPYPARVAGPLPIHFPGRAGQWASLAITDALCAKTRLPFLLLDLAVAWILFARTTSLAAGLESDPRIIAASAVFAPTLVLTTLGMGLYDRIRRYDWENIIRGSLIGTALAALAVMWCFGSVLPGAVSLNGAMTAWLGVAALHLVPAALLKNYSYRFTILGSSAYMEEVKAFCRRAPQGWRLYSHVPWDRLRANHFQPTAEKLQAAGIGELVLAKEAMDEVGQFELALGFLPLNCRVVDEAAFYVGMFERLPLDAIDKGWLLEHGLARRQLVTTAVKRALDVLLAGVAIVALSPLLALIAVAIKVSSRGPILFVQTRQGQHLVPFTMYKFRTMYAHRGSAEAEGGFTRNNDGRVTPVGRLVRRFHLDELPQLWNVLRGEMSLVGPRPEVLSFAERIRRSVPLYELRYIARPGLTGYAQINQGYAMDSVVDTKRKLSYDLYYLCNHNLWSDLSIMIRTLFVLARGAR